MTQTDRGSKLIESKLSCPECPSSDAYCLYDDGHGYCYSCTYYKPPEGRDGECTYEYLPLRGISKRTLEFYDVKTKVDAEGKPMSVGFVYPNGAVKVRLLGEKIIYWSPKRGTQPGLFGRNKFAAGSDRSITITEGEFDALALQQAIGHPVVSVQSSGSAVRDCVADLSFLESFDRVYLAFDSDSVGREAAVRVAKLFDFRKVYHVKFSNRKDANEYLLAGEVDELRNIWANARKFLPETVVAISRDVAAQILSAQPKTGVPYPFPDLNTMTYGMRTGESVLITAQEGVGKTEFMHAIEYQLLRGTNDNIGAIFLEEPKAQHLRALAAIELKKPVHLPDTGSTELEVLDAVEKAVGQDERLHVYSHFGSDDPDVLLGTIRYLVSGVGCRWILLDHISMVVSALSGEDERRALDYIATRLEMMVKELDFGLLFVSHVNDYGQTRGSRYIGKIADIRVDITRDVMHSDLALRNTITVSVPKNRPIGMTGSAGSYLFDQYTRQYVPVAANDNMETDDAGHRNRKAA